MRITKSVAFDAAHYLGECPDGRPYARLHGHSFKLDATLEGEPDPKEGWVADFADLAGALEEIRADLDHRLLNEVEGLARPTLENICAYVATRLRRRFATLKQVRVSRPSNGESCVLEM
ncbi:MAG: 6-pyruvoyl tetrahydropterin synthase family protein [Parvularculaceae bacterium]|jgi:6-pyruvoyltetrahydropterin/6-carboxytetrahydropterin synthase|nr:6-pyruvoyl tetrahydropterin synthase family protein [Parvularculaceae bacterium]